MLSPYWRGLCCSGLVVDMFRKHPCWTREQPFDELADPASGVANDSSDLSYSKTPASQCRHLAPLGSGVAASGLTAPASTVARLLQGVELPTAVLLAVWYRWAGGGRAAFVATEGDVVRVQGLAA